MNGLKKIKITILNSLAKDIINQEKKLNPMQKFARKKLGETQEVICEMPYTVLVYFKNGPNIFETLMPSIIFQLNLDLEKAGLKSGTDYIIEAIDG